MPPRRPSRIPVRPARPLGIAASPPRCPSTLHHAGASSRPRCRLDAGLIRRRENRTVVRHLVPSLAYGNQPVASCRWKGPCFETLPAACLPGRALRTFKRVIAEAPFDQTLGTERRSRTRQVDRSPRDRGATRLPEKENRPNSSLL